jgi:hypothetical protein
MRSNTPNIRMKASFRLLAGHLPDRGSVSKNSSGKESLVAIVLAVPDYVANTPDKPMISFEERKSGAPKAIHSWFYPGDNTGWEVLAEAFGEIGADSLVFLLKSDG